MTPQAAHVLFTGLIAGKPVRFFASDKADPDFPFHAVEDLHAALQMPRSLRKVFKVKLRSSEWRDDIRKVAVDGAVVTICPHYMAQGVIGAMVDMGVAPPNFEMDYRIAGTKAFEAECKALGLTDAQTADRAFAAATGKPGLKMKRRINTDTGEMLINMGDAQDALGLSDEEIKRAHDQLVAEGHGEIFKAVDPSKLATIQ